MANTVGAETVGDRLIFHILILIYPKLSIVINFINNIVFVTIIGGLQVNSNSYTSGLSMKKGE